MYTYFPLNLLFHFFGTIIVLLIQYENFPKAAWYMIKNERIKTNLRKEDFFYALPPERIAQTPVDKRDASRLMVVNRSSGAIAHPVFLRYSRVYPSRGRAGHQQF